MKKTKIVATISDNRCSPEFLSELYNSGMDVMRLNTAHQSIEGTKICIENCRKVNDKIAIMIDTKGPEIRTCPMDSPLDVKTGQIVYMSGGKQTDKSEHSCILVNYPDFVNVIPQGARIMIDDAALELKVISKEGDKLKLEALNNGVIKQKKSVNVPGAYIKRESVNARDKEYIEFAIKEDIEFIAHSFVQSKADILEIQEILDKHKSDIKIIAKIENQAGVDNIDEILDSAYGIMIARGDLGVEVPAAEVPMIQKALIKKCIQRQKVVITATQMLESMTKNPRPTRAEVSDVANAILDGTSAVMLSGESAHGDYPVEAVKTLATIAKELESKKAEFKQFPMDLKADDARTVFAKAAITACSELGNIKAIICPTVTGKTPRALSSFRAKWPIYAQCYDKKVMRRLAMSYGVFPTYIQEQSSTDNLVSEGLKQLTDNNELNPADHVIILGRTPGQDEEATNFMEITSVSHGLKNYKK